MQFQATLADDVEVPATGIDETAALAEKSSALRSWRNRFRFAAIAALVLIPIGAWLNTPRDDPPRSRPPTLCEPTKRRVAAVSPYNARRAWLRPIPSMSAGSSFHRD